MRAISGAEGRLWLVAAVCFAAFALLGAYVSSRTPTRIDVEATALRGDLTSLAVFFTTLGRWYVLLPLTAVAVAVAFAERRNPWLPAAILASQTLSQAVINLAKIAFGRPRPDDWLVYREQGLSFPSGHAATTVVFYAAFALLVLRTPGLPRGVVAATALAFAAVFVGIPWSRLALGAHYATDVAGGVLFGAGWLCASLALVVRFAP